MTATLFAQPDLTPIVAARRRVRRRRRAVTLTLLALVLVAFFVRVLMGADYTYTLPDAISIVFGKDIPVASYLLMESKLPRALLGLLVGAALGAGGAIFQTMLRNPLASPDIVGVSMGASVAGIAALLLFDLEGRSVSIAAIVGALAIAAVVRWLAGGAGGYRLVLAGVALSTSMVGLVHYVISRASIYDAQLALRWLTGSLNDASWPDVRLLTTTLTFLIPVIYWLTRGLPISELGDDAAAGLGLPRWHTDALLAVGVLLVAVAVAVAGPVAFVAFMSGPIARALHRGRASIIGGALVGALIVLVADYVAAYALGDIRMPVGVITGAIGAPFLLVLLARGAASGRRGA